ncbi:glutaredoxin family protein [Pseudomaricurvus alkylphenolicus]|uniref:glutaredoxin family protein n=1 Tax=Pseudomaricurvus alkylphenolicus TaxID=1306991 RepID=UPI00141E26F7|nr:glutaredoxin family protein [Pseudomaricurvus alkylphenolicus]NIB41298.1 glutaredoxin family protein [Pseudomaricurvus alkylphenolicus]
MRTLYLYTTLGCHLCDQAKMVCWPVLEPLECRLEEVEIADDDALLQRYGVRIPVVRLAGSMQDLGWPFDGSQLNHYLRQTLRQRPSSEE